MKIKRLDLKTLEQSGWLNDEVINFYLQLIKERCYTDINLPKVEVFNSFFYPSIMARGYEGVKRWNKIDVFSVDLLFIPVHLGLHWCLAVIDFKNKEIIYYDSAKGDNENVFKKIKEFLAGESRFKRKENFNFTGWKELTPKDIPLQMNNFDCGVFTCIYAEFKSRYGKFSFTQENMPYFRTKMINEILSKKLL